MNFMAVYIFTVIGCQAIFKTIYEPLLYRFWYNRTNRIKYDEWMSILTTFRIITWTPVLNMLFLATVCSVFYINSKKEK